jgi:hypothetical protein
MFSLEYKSIRILFSAVAVVGCQLTNLCACEVATKLACHAGNTKVLLNFPVAWLYELSALRACLHGGACPVYMDASYPVSSEIPELCGRDREIHDVC